ncbi:MAG: low-specificity L-threonine aldolase [Pirellulales bacterium]|nr:low-specificity L-threonine aldolase [Pirellulales bacterium]
MNDKLYDFRSDTVTRPTPAMRAAMAAAEVGDDVLGDDPTVLRLQQVIAERMGKEAALFVPSGTMSNLIAVRTHCRPGDELICEDGCHIYNYEQSGYAQICGIAARAVKGEFGVLRREQLADLIRPGNAHYVRTRLLTLENTHNRGGGKIQPYAVVEEICRWARESGLKTHLDGARLYNAAVATGIQPPEWTRHFDSVSVCFSKGLGAPAGSALCGAKDLIAEAVRHRKVLGGAMRQSGVLAAAALYALEHNIERLAEDHANARRLADGIRNIEHLRLVSAEIDTNMIFFRVDPAWGTAAEFVEKIKSQGVWMLSTAPATIRAVTHLDVTKEDVDRAIAIIASIMRAR